MNKQEIQMKIFRSCEKEIARREMRKAVRFLYANEAFNTLTELGIDNVVEAN